MERDAGFYSGGSENGDDFQRDDPRSPTDASDDSIDVKLTAIVIPKNKRKSLEPSRVVAETDYPLKKRIKFEPITTIKSEPFDQNPFRPWASVTDAESSSHTTTTTCPQPNPAAVLVRHPGVTTLHRIPDSPSVALSVASIQDQPLALLKKRNSTTPILTEYDNAVNSDACSPFRTAYPPGGNTYRQPLPPPQPESNQHLDDDDDDDINPAEAFMSLMASAAAAGELPGGGTNSSDDSFGSHNKQSNHHQQHRNYKNMTRERRIEANARERTRVHTISAAFDTLRKSIPSYSQSQKLSKLSVLRVACSYILTLSRIAGDDYSPDHSEPSVNECTDEVSRTIQTEGKIRKKKDEQ